MKYATERNSIRKTAPPQPSLPPADTVRWVARRKAEVVTAVYKGMLSM